MKKKLKKLVKKLQEQQGFTLVELMVVVVIIGILAAIAIPQFSKQANQAKNGSAEATMKSMADIINVYYSQNGSFPTALNDTTAGGIANVLQQNGINWIDSGVTGSGLQDPWGNAYQYWLDGSGNFTLLCTGSDGAIDTASPYNDIVVTGNKSSGQISTPGITTSAQSTGTNTVVKSK